MTSTTTVLVAQDPHVIQEIQQLHDNSEPARLEVCGRMEKLPGRLGKGHTILLIHANSSNSSNRIRSLLDLADRLQVRCAAVWRPDSDHDKTPPVFGPYPVFELPSGIPKLVEFLHKSPGDHSFETSGASQSSTPVDQIAATILGSDMADQMERIRRVSEQNTTILLTGETGSGKSMMTRFIHTNSPREMSHTWWSIVARSVAS